MNSREEKISTREKELVMREKSYYGEKGELEERIRGHERDLAEVAGLKKDL